MTNQTFQIERFAKLIKRTFNQNKKTWIIFTVVFVGIPLLLSLFNLKTANPIPAINRAVFLKLGIGIIFILSPFIFFYNTTHPKKGLPEVMLPASILEKFLNMMLYCILIAPLSVIILYGAIDSLIAIISPTHFDGYAIKELGNLFNDWTDILLINFLFQGLFLCNLLFSKHKILKTIGTYMGLSFLFGLITALVTVIAAKNGLTPLHLDLSNRGLFEIYRTDNVIVVLSLLSRIFIEIILPVILFISSYFVLKNKRY